MYISLFTNAIYYPLLGNNQLYLNMLSNYLSPNCFILNFDIWEGECASSIIFSICFTISGCLSTTKSSSLKSTLRSYSSIAILLRKTFSRTAFKVHLNIQKTKTLHNQLNTFSLTGKSAHFISYLPLLNLQLLFQHHIHISF